MKSDDKPSKHNIYNVGACYWLNNIQLRICSKMSCQCLSLINRGFGVFFPPISFSSCQVCQGSILDSPEIELKARIRDDGLGKYKPMEAKSEEKRKLRAEWEAMQGDAWPCCSLLLDKGTGAPAHCSASVYTGYLRGGRNAAPESSKGRRKGNLIAWHPSVSSVPIHPSLPPMPM